MKGGFIAIHRSALEHPVIGEAAQFRAWFWLVANACWKPTRVKIKGKIVTLERGQLSFSQRFMAESWGWSKSRVDRFIAELRNEGMIETCSKNGATAGHSAGQGQAVITICNYDKYQHPETRKRGNAEPKNGATAGQQRGKEEQGNKGTSNKEPKGSMREIDLPVGVSQESWDGFLEMREAKKKPPTAQAVSTIFGKLEKWRDAGHDPNEILNTSTENCWTTVYEPKGGMTAAQKTEAEKYGDVW